MADADQAKARLGSREEDCPLDQDRQVAEQAVLGAVLCTPELLDDLRETLDVGDFADPRHQLAYHSMLALGAQGIDPAPVAVIEDLRRRGRLDEAGGDHYVLDLVNAGVLLGAAFESNCALVRAAADRRRLVRDLRLALQDAEAGVDAGAVRARLLAAVETTCRPDSLRVLDWRAVTELPPLRWLVGGWIPEHGVGFLCGEPSSGKSFAALDLAARMACGKDWFGRSVVPGASLFLAGEGFGGVGGRLAAWRRHHDAELPLHPFDVVDGIPPLEAASAAEYRRLLDGFAKRHGAPPAVTWIDTFAAAVAGDENNSEAVLAAFRVASDLRRIYGCAVAIVDHVRKAQQSGAPARMSAHDLRGHSSKRGNADFVIGVERTGTGRELVCLKSKDGGEPDPIRFDLVTVETGRLREDGSAETSCVVAASSPLAKVDDALVEAQKQREHDEHLAELVDAVVEQVRSLGGVRNMTGALAGIRGRRANLVAAWHRAVALQLIVDIGTARKPRFVPADTAKSVCVLSPHTPPEREREREREFPSPRSERSREQTGTDGNTGTRAVRA